jgi:hypothetical protein
LAAHCDRQVHLTDGRVDEVVAVETRRGRRGMNETRSSRYERDEVVAV